MLSQSAVTSDYLELSCLGERVVGTQEAADLVSLESFGWPDLDFKGGAKTGVLGRNRAAAMCAVHFEETGLGSIRPVEGYGTDPAAHEDAVLSDWWRAQKRQAAAQEAVIPDSQQNPRQVHPDVSKRFENVHTISTFAVKGHSFTGLQIVILGDRFNPDKHPRQNGEA